MLRNLFVASVYNFIFSPSGWGLVLVMYALAFAFGLIYRAIFINFSMILLKMGLIKPTSEVLEINNKPNKNIGKLDRVLRLIIGLGLLFWAIFTTWSPILIFLSGFCIFEAVFSWCAFYAAIDKSTCSLE